MVSQRKQDYKSIASDFRYFIADGFAENFNAELRKKLGKEIEVVYIFLVFIEITHHTHQ